MVIPQSVQRLHADLLETPFLLGTSQLPNLTTRTMGQTNSPKRGIHPLLEGDIDELEGYRRERVGTMFGPGFIDLMCSNTFAAALEASYAAVPQTTDDTMDVQALNWPNKHQTV